MRRLDLAFTALQVPVDFLALVAAAITAYLLRFSQPLVEIRPIIQDITLPQYIGSVSTFIVAWMLCFLIAGLYPTKQRPRLQELSRIVLGSTAGMMVIIATVFFRRELTTSRFLVIAVWALAMIYVWIGRTLLRAIRHALLSRGHGHQRIVVIGSSNAAAALKTLYLQKPWHGYTVVKSYKTWTDDAAAEVLQMKQRHQVDGILLAEPRMSKEQSLDLINFAEEYHLGFRYLADLFAAKFTRIDVSAEAGIPIIEPKRTPLDGWGRIIKRAFDIVVASAVLILTSPLLLLSGLIILLQDGFPILFHNERVGERGKHFPVYKLRSMWKRYCIGPQFSAQTKQNIEFEQQLIKQKSIKNGPVYKITEDPRITPFGRFIRRWSIDELPQFINVLQGTMSIVGPRPHQPREVEKYQSHHRKVFAIKPGITGMAQVSGRSDLSFDEESRLDTWYIDHWSLWLDIVILLKTPFVIVRQEGAY